ncbi:uncharacterized protein K444DRAFT_631646 [Hyaloscypha bicolor E]|uniref:Heterokaryon incompatibility domain-containing protein n=1 Tax=Hyaloscypha bicolor E TaxID=1095630 RepID=A0A2J6T4G1_9HELO|nr:uncharacterized protein K444DRAFT_631646 [Hyaloscypha bicolor E]PMD57920.1 hypothetical protein K444DRAFT_631646 [Hyaloscypha bicolor E]
MGTHKLIPISGSLHNSGTEVIYEGKITWQLLFRNSFSTVFVRGKLAVVRHEGNYWLILKDGDLGIPISTYDEYNNSVEFQHPTREIAKRVREDSRLPFTVKLAPDFPIIWAIQSSTGIALHLPLGSMASKWCGGSKEKPLEKGWLEYELVFMMEQAIKSRRVLERQSGIKRLQIIYDNGWNMEKIEASLAAGNNPRPPLYVQNGHIVGCRELDIISHMQFFPETTKPPKRLVNLQTGEVEVSTGQDINYAALLYVWNNGSVAEKVAIYQRLLNNKTGRETTHPWVDQLCIDQGNPAEIAEEVIKMASYYRGASRIINRVNCQLARQ